MKIIATTLFILLSWWVSDSVASCTGSSPTWTSTPDQASVQTCVNNAGTNDTVLMTAGSVTWADTVTVPDNKNLTIQGAGIDQTLIVTKANPGIEMGRGNKSITGFSIIIAGADGIRIDGDGWKVSNMKLQSSTSSIANGVHARGLRTTSGTGPTGLIHHTNFVDSRVLVIGLPDKAWKSGAMWTSDLGLGDANAVYIEDSTITFTTAKANAIDCNYGGRYVLRFMRIVGTSIDAHSTQEDMRACRRWEIYNNTTQFLSPFFTPFYVRGGTGVIFNTSFDAGWSEPYLSFDIRRAFETNSFFLGSSMGKCDGTSPADGNIIHAGNAGAGWPCRDQIGMGQDRWQWTTANPNPPQISMPAYFWNNTIGGSPAIVNIRNGVSAWIKPNRDYYNHMGGTQTSSTSPFNGTSGMGVGTLANRPPACTKGVAYWVTDEGEWNSREAGPDGQLYKCTATNTWTLYYRPFPYPHPLQNTSGATFAPPTPQNVNVARD